MRTLERPARAEPCAVSPTADGGALADLHGGAGNAAAAEALRGTLSGLLDELSVSLGTDVRDVRLHPGDADAATLGARAYAEGEEVFFAPGAFDPGTREGRRLVAHEVAHVVQQRGTAPSGDVSDPSDGHEIEARRFADAFVAGRSAPVRHRGIAALSRDEDAPVPTDAETLEPMVTDRRERDYRPPDGARLGVETSALRRFTVWGFAVGDHHVPDGGLGTLERVVDLCRNRTPYAVHVVGHASRTGPEAQNRDLSTLRAHEVEDHLVAQGIDGGLIQAVGEGSALPQHGDRSEVDRAAQARDRRVNVSIEWPEARRDPVERQERPDGDRPRPRGGERERGGGRREGSERDGGGRGAGGAGGGSDTRFAFDFPERVWDLPPPCRGLSAQFTLTGRVEGRWVDAPAGGPASIDSDPLPASTSPGARVSGRVQPASPTQGTRTRATAQGLLLDEVLSGAVIGRPRITDRWELSGTRAQETAPASGSAQAAVELQWDGWTTPGGGRLFPTVRVVLVDLGSQGVRVLQTRLQANLERRLVRVRLGGGTADVRIRGTGELRLSPDLTALAAEAAARFGLRAADAALEVGAGAAEQAGTRAGTAVAEQAGTRAAGTASTAVAEQAGTRAAGAAATTGADTTATALASRTATGVAARAAGGALTTSSTAGTFATTSTGGGGLVATSTTESWALPTAVSSTAAPQGTGAVAGEAAAARAAPAAAATAPGGGAALALRTLAGFGAAAQILGAEVMLLQLVAADLEAGDRRNAALRRGAANLFDFCRSYARVACGQSPVPGRAGEDGARRAAADLAAEARTSGTTAAAAAARVAAQAGVERVHRDVYARVRPAYEQALARQLEQLGVSPDGAAEHAGSYADTVRPPDGDGGGAMYGPYAEDRDGRADDAEQVRREQADRAWCRGEGLVGALDLSLDLRDLRRRMGASAPRSFGLAAAEVDAAQSRLQAHDALGARLALIRARGHLQSARDALPAEAPERAELERMVGLARRLGG